MQASSIWIGTQHPLGYLMDSAFLKSLQLYNGPRLILEAERLFASQERIVGGGLQMDSQLLTGRPSTSTPSFRLPDFVIYLAIRSSCSCLAFET